MAPGGAERVMDDMRANGYSIWTDARNSIIKDKPLVYPGSACGIRQDDLVGLDGFSFTGASVDVFSSAWENFEAGPDGASSDATMCLRESMNMREGAGHDRRSRIAQQLDALLRTGNMGDESMAALDRLLREGLAGMSEGNSGSQSTDSTASRAREGSPEYQDCNAEEDNLEAQQSQVIPATAWTDVNNIIGGSSGRNPSPGLPANPSSPQANPSVSQDRSVDVPVINFNSPSWRRRNPPIANSLHKARGEPFVGESSIAGAQNTLPSPTPDPLAIANNTEGEPFMGESSIAAAQNFHRFSTPHPPSNPSSCATSRHSQLSEDINSANSLLHDLSDVGSREFVNEPLVVATSASFDLIAPESRQPLQTCSTIALRHTQDAAGLLTSSRPPFLSSDASGPSTPLTTLPKVSDQLLALSGPGLPQKRRPSEHDSDYNVFATKLKRPRISADQNSTSPTRASTPTLRTPRTSSSAIYQVSASSAVAAPLQRVVSTSSTWSTFSTRTLRPTTPSADPIRLASQKRQRSQLRDLIAKCDRARSVGTSVSKLQVSKTEQLDISASLSSLPVTDELPGSMDLDLVRQLMRDIQNGGSLQLSCVESQ